MFDYQGEFETIGSSHEVLPEDEDALARTVEITKEVFSAPKSVKLDHIHYAIEEWENLQAYLDDPNAADLIGEVVELLGEVAGRQTLGFQDAQRGKQMVLALAKFFGISARRGFHAWD